MSSNSDLAPASPSSPARQLKPSRRGEDKPVMPYEPAPRDRQRRDPNQDPIPTMARVESAAQDLYAMARELRIRRPQRREP